VTAERRGLREVPLTQLAPDPTQPRTFFDEAGLRELAASLAAHGVLEPLLATENPDPGSREATPYLLLAGERRWRAAQIAGLATVPVLVREEPATGLDRTLLQLAENDAREDLSLLDRARALQQMVEQSGLAKRAIAERLGKSLAWLSNLLALAAAEGTALQALEEGLIRHAETARQFQKLPTRDQKDLLSRAGSRGEAITLRQVRDRATRIEAREAARRETKPKPPLPASDRATDALLDLTTPPELDLVALGEVSAPALRYLLELVGAGPMSHRAVTSETAPGLVAELHQLLARALTPSD